MEPEAPSPLLIQFSELLLRDLPPGPILDLAGGAGRNALWLAQKGARVVCCDRSREALSCAQKKAQTLGISMETWEVDLEVPGTNPLPEDGFSGVIVFRYLYRPLIPCIKKAIKPGGILIYETFTVEQRRFGKPRNPDHLLEPGELLGWFSHWIVIHYFEGILPDPPRAMAQLVSRKPHVALGPLPVSKDE